MIEYQKTKSVTKQIEFKGAKLDEIIIDTVNKISSIVGSTLGPGGSPVLIERYEFDLPPTVTKDGVTVFRALGFDNSAAHVIMESMRDAALKTATDAGDGTTTATILAASIITAIKSYCKANPKVSPQKIMRQLDEIFLDIIEPTIKKLSKKLKLNKSGLKQLKAVAKLSANGDEDLASAVMKCFEIGDDGNVTIETFSGSSGTEVEQIEGYPIGIGYENTCKGFWPQFINDPGNQQTRLENPVFLLYNGKITEIQTISPILQAVGISASPQNTPEGATPFSKNLVIVATGFSDSVLANLGGNFPNPETINVLPLLVPTTIQQGSEFEFLQDVASITGATMFDMLSNPISNAKLEHLGSGIELFEFGRYRSSIIGNCDEGLALYRIDEVKQQLKNSISELDKIINTERLAKLSGGIAKLKIYGSSNGETKEKRDRAEDAVCAVRGAVKHGCLPGGAWTLLKIIDVLLQMDREDVIDKILVPALAEPFKRLVANCGIVDENEIFDIKATITDHIVLNRIGMGNPVVYDFLEQKHVDAFKSGILDSTPAVLEAIRNALSIAGRIGTLGGVIVQRRDQELDRSEAVKTNSFLRMANEENPANEKW
jgi:chaperonin GroEL